MNIQAKPLLIGLGVVSVAAAAYFAIRGRGNSASQALDRIKAVTDGKKRSKHYWEIMNPKQA